MSKNDWVIAILSSGTGLMSGVITSFALGFTLTFVTTGMWLEIF